MTQAPEAFWDLYPLPTDQPVVRVVREAEKQAEVALLAGKLIYVRGPRKCGKSSLMERLSVRLAEGTEVEGKGRQKPRLVVQLELDNVGRNLDEEMFRFALSKRQTDAFDELIERAGLGSTTIAALRRKVDDSPGWFWRALRALAEAVDTPVVVFIDEVEEVLGDHRSLGESWLVALRQAHIDAGGRLAVCCLGLMPASLLVRSPERTPFNTALEIRLPDFTLKQVEDMAAHLQARHHSKDLTDGIALALHNEAAGQPNMTQFLLKKLQEAFAQDPTSTGDYPEILRDLVEHENECKPPTTNTYMALRSIFKRPSVWPSHDALVVYSAMLQAAEAQGRRAVPAVLYDPWSEAHTMLEAIGLARVEREGKDELLVARSRIARRMFNRAWALEQLTGLGGAEPEAAGEASQALNAMETLARDELCATDWAVTHKAKITAGSGRERTPGALFEFELVRDNPAERLTLQMFRGVGEFGKRLWLRQVRTLRHLSGRADALPNIYRGGLLDGDKVAYIITQRPELTLADPGFPDYVAAHRDWAMDQFSALADALARMAEEGISHRNIWPGAIRMDAPQDNTPPPQMTLASYEFSVMLRTMVAGEDGTTAGSRGRHGALRAAFLRQPPASRLFAPPELLDGLFGVSGQPIPALVTGDVFSLGMVVLGWFLPLPPPAAFEPVLRQDGPDAAAYDGEAHKAYVRDLGGAIERAIASRHLPAALGRVLQAMIRWDARQRLRPAEVTARLAELLPALRIWSSGHRQPLLVCYSYREMSAELRKSGILTTAPDTEDDRLRVEDILSRELSRAVLFHAPRGIAPFVSEANADQRAAEWVLMGPTWLFYCQRYERRTGGFSGPRIQTKHILRLAYAWPRRRAWRAVPAKQVGLAAYGVIELAEQRGSPALDPINDAKYRRWDALLGEARRLAPPPSFEVAQTAFSWLVEAQREAVELRRFPVNRVGAGSGQAEYQLDLKAYQIWRDANVMRSQVSQADTVKDVAERFEQLMQVALDDGDRGMRVRDYRDPPTSPWSQADLIRVSGAGISVRGDTLPNKAWVQLNEARWARRPIEQQEVAINDLADNPALFDQLLDPHIIVDDELIDEGDLAAAVKDLAGRSPEIVRKIVTSSPLVALQGPPGTGKTTVIAAVTQGLLTMDPTQRILITSQSNAAVDHIALRVRELGLADEDHTICVRVASEQAFRDDGAVDPRVRDMKPDIVAARIARRLRQACAEKLAVESNPDLRKAYEQLARVAEEGGLELAERVRESAAVVFATTAGSKRVVDEVFLPANSRFDMTIVDEASKAWPMEIVQPMLLATRSLLVGDHRQLPAFGSTDMTRLLRQCIDSGREEFNVLANHPKAIEAWMKLFATFFDNSAAKVVTGSDGSNGLPGWRDNREVAEQLNLQFRMRSDIADMVSRTFYNGKLQSHPSVDQRTKPDWLKAFAKELGADRGVVWIDTPRGTRFQNDSPGLNRDQAQIAAGLLGRAVYLGADAAAGRDAVILSPYKLQRSAIYAELNSKHRAGLEMAVHTADSFQGQEAELVILPLTRGPPPDGGKAERAIQRYGFLVEKERCNVMVSRARELLVILGDFDFFAEAMDVEALHHPGGGRDLSFWTRLCDHVRINGRVIDYRNLPHPFELK